MTKILTGIIAVLGILCFALYWRVGALEMQKVDLAYVADKLEAQLDTTRLIVTKDSAQRAVWQRRAEQAEEVRDSLMEANRSLARANVNAAAMIDSLRVTLTTAVVVDSADVRSIDVAIRDEPYTIMGSVALPPPPDSGVIDLMVTLDSLILDVVVGCGPESPSGLRPALVNIEGPSWARIRIGRSQVARGNCNPVTVVRLPQQERPSLWPSFVIVGAGAGIGALIDDNPYRGAALGAGGGLVVDIQRRGLLDLFRALRLY